MTRLQTDRERRLQTNCVSLFVCGLSPLIHWCLTISSPPYCSPNSLQVPHFFPDLFFPPCLYSYSPLCENAQMLNVIGCAHTKNVWHSLKHLSSSHSLLYPPAFLTVWNPFTAVPLPFLLFMPFIGFITTHFATSPPNSLLLPSYPIHHWIGVWVRQALTHKPKHLAPWTPPHPSHPHIQIGTETSE